MANTGINSEIIIMTLLGGFLPVLLWLWFWLKEDARRPEPKPLIAAAFIAGLIAVALALFLEKAARDFIGEGFLLIIVWAAIEEILKFGGAYIVAFRKTCLGGIRCLDEAVDPMIYLITVALGFAALENTLFLIKPLGQGEPLASFLTGNLRFLGATILHVVASASIGVAMGLSFYKSAHLKRIYALVGIFTAISLHALFNFSIILNKGENIFIVFSVLWFAALLLLLVFEKIKKVRRE